MSGTKKSTGGGSTRSLPSWMNSRENDNKSSGKKPTGDGEGEESNEGEKPKQAKGRGKGHIGTTNVSKLLVLNYCKMGFSYCLVWCVI
jgi:hypothetical protein